MFRRMNLLVMLENQQNNENDKKKKQIIKMRRQLRDKSNPFDLPNQIFVQRFRVSKEAFAFILETLEISHGKRVTYIPPVIRLAVTLETLGGGGYKWLTGNDFGIALGQSTLSKIVTTTVNILEEKICPFWIKWTVSDEGNKAETKQWFYRYFSIPGVVGCIDGTHLFMQRPSENEHLYFNRKGKHSLNAMIICDHKLRIMAINARYGGAAHDSLVWRHSNEKSYFENKFNERAHDGWLLGDSGYPLEPWLLTPYRSSSDVSTTSFNNIHAKARNLVERCIGVYKGRWRILIEERKSSYSPTKIATFANVCAALHNICIHFNIQGENLAVVEENLPHYNISSLEPQNGNNQMRQFAENLRDDIKNSL